MDKMRISNNGINLIKKYEGCRLVAYKPVAAEKYWTIGWGHYGADVTQGMKITQAKADELLISDLTVYEAHVRRICNYLDLNQNQFDALVSFTYNCGSGNLLKLTKNQSRSSKEIAEHIEAYNKGANNQVLAGLVRRRKEEKELFLRKEEAMADVPELTIQEKVKEIERIAALDDNTGLYFQFYRYSIPLIDKLYAICVDAEKWRNQAKN